jgi:ricin-type beta-trefoil lectin protein
MAKVAPVRPSSPPPARSKRWLWFSIAGSVVVAFAAIGIAWWALHRGSGMVPRDGLVCLLVNQNSGRCLSVANGAAEPGAKIVQGPLPKQGRASERWILLKVEDGYHLKNENSQMMLEIPGGNKNHGVQAIQWYDGYTQPNQIWAFEKVGASYLIRVRHTGQALAIGQGLKDEGAAAVQWDELPDSADQLWILQRPF